VAEASTGLGAVTWLGTETGVTGTGMRTGGGKGVAIVHCWAPQRRRVMPTTPPTAGWLLTYSVLVHCSVTWADCNVPIVDKSNWCTYFPAKAFKSEMGQPLDCTCTSHCSLAKFRVLMISWNTALWLAKRIP